MNKVVKENYEEIIKDLEVLFNKWTVGGITGAIWKYTRTRSRLQELKEKQSEIEKELKQLKHYEKIS